MNINKDKARNAIYSAAGIYMLYTAWMIYGNLGDADGDGTLFLIFTIVFAVAGVALIGLGFWNLYKENQKTGSQSVTDKDQSETAATPGDTAESDEVPEASDDNQISAAASADNVQISVAASTDDELTSVKSAPDDASLSADAEIDPVVTSVQEDTDSAADLQ